jgi:hypothetical protein
MVLRLEAEANGDGATAHVVFEIVVIVVAKALDGGVAAFETETEAEVRPEKDRGHDLRPDVENQRHLPGVTGTERVTEQGGQDITLGGTVTAGGTTISGVLRDSSGKPVANVYAAAYRDAMMTMKPDFISSPTAADGVYTISVAEGGDYYIGARNTIGGPAEKGDLLGRYAGNEDHVVHIATDEKLSGIDVVVEPVE